MKEEFLRADEKVVDATAFSLMEELDEENQERRSKRKDDRLRKHLVVFRHLRDPQCPRCGTDLIAGNGHSDFEIPEYRCPKCHFSFVITDRTNLSSSNLDLKTIRDIVIFTYFGASLEFMCFYLGISKKTAILWQRRVFAIAQKHLDGEVLSDKVWIDEVYFYVSKELGIMAADKDHIKAGLNDDFVCVCIGTDRHNHRYCKLEKRGKASQDVILDAFRGHVREKSTLVHDNERSHNRLVDEYSLRSVVVPSKPKTDKSLKKMRPINNYSALLVNEMRKHVGVRTTHLQEWLSFITYRAEIRENYGNREAIEIILSGIFSSKKTVFFKKHGVKRNPKEMFI